MAETQTLARPYARAAFDSAAAGDALPGWSDNLSRLATLASDAAARPLLGHPAVTQKQLVDLFQGAADPGAPAGVGNLLRLLAENRRLVLLPSIATQFEALRAAHEARANVTVTSAAVVGDDKKSTFEAALGKRLGATVTVTWTTDPDLIGGAVVTSGDLVIDGSVRGELNRLRASLSN